MPPSSANPSASPRKATRSRTAPSLTPHPNGSPDEELHKFKGFAKAVKLNLEPFQEEILAEAFSDRRELLALLPRGNGKTTLFAALALYRLLRDPEAAIFVAAASRDQATVLYEQARKLIERSREVESRLTIRHREIKSKQGGGKIKVLASDAPLVHGLIPSLVLVDELHAHKNEELYVALRTAMHKVPGSRMVTISTAGVDGIDGPLIHLRNRALALPNVTRDGPKVTAHGKSLAMLEWSVPQDADVTDMKVVKQANPASWIYEESLEELRESVQPLQFRRYHANQWTAVEEHWLPEGAWQRCSAAFSIDPGESIGVGIDIGGEHAASAVVWATEDLRVGAEVFQGERALFQIIEKLEALADEYDLLRVYYDPWRFQQAAMTFEDMRLPMAEFPQNPSRMIPASERLYEAVISQRLKHPNDPELNRHVAAAIAKQTPRGWKLDKSTKASQIDAVIAMALAVEAAETAQRFSGPLIEWLA